MERKDTFNVSKLKWLEKFIYSAIFSTFCWYFGLFHDVVTPVLAAEYTGLPIVNKQIETKKESLPVTMMNSKLSSHSKDLTTAIDDSDEQGAYDDGYNSGYEKALTEVERKHKKTVALVKSELSIETVSLTPNELAKVEYLNAEKALDQENSKQAALNLESALYYRPDWIMARQKLAALYYGRGNVQEAIETLERGLARQPNQIDLRLTLAKLLINESQPQTALTVLNELSGHMSIEYLAMRGALAQQLNNSGIALTCYQTLIRRSPNDGRWWLGLAIVQERTHAFTQAVASYHKALEMGNISSSSTLFIQQRLVIIKQQQQQQQHKA